MQVARGESTHGVMVLHAQFRWGDWYFSVYVVLQARLFIGRVTCHCMVMNQRPLKDMTRPALREGQINQKR